MAFVETILLLPQFNLTPMTLKWRDFNKALIPRYYSISKVSSFRVLNNTLIEICDYSIKLTRLLSLSTRSGQAS